MATRGYRRRQARRAARRDAKKPRQQFYGGSQEAADQLRTRNQGGVDSGTALEDQGLQGLDAERANAGANLRELGITTSGERSVAANRTADLLTNAQRLQRQQARNATSYGTGADSALSDYVAGRGATLANAATLEKNAANAQGRYQSAADAAFKAAQARNQQNALSLAAGRGNNAMRTALAASTSANRDAALQQQVVKAQEANELMGLENDATARAADIRAGVGQQDQGAANIQAGRQQVATGAAGDYLRTRGDLTAGDARVGLDAMGQRADLAKADAQLGVGVSGAKADAGSGRRDQYLGSEANMEGAQLGSNSAYEQARLARAQTRGFTGFLGRLAGGLGNIKATADAGSFGPGTKLLGAKQPTPY